MTYTTPANLTNFFDLFSWANNVTNNTFVSMVVIIFTLIVFGVSQPISKSASQSFTFASFFGLIASMFFGFLGLVSGQFYMLFVLFTAVGVIWMRFDRTQSS